MKKTWMFGLAFLITAQANAQELLLQAGKPGATVSPQMWGIFFEDINFGADGGLYAEMVKNRSFEFDRPMMGWKESRKGGNGLLVVTNRVANPNNPRYLKLTVDAPSGAYGLQNEGFRGMGVKGGDRYHFSVMAHAPDAKGISLEVRLVNSKGDSIGSGAIQNISGDWKKYTVSFTASQTDAKAALQLLFTGVGTIELDMVSLFPADTWKGRPGGLRKDLVQKLADLMPGFIRFPGGCIVEGFNLNQRYQWKTTVGPVEERKVIINRWNFDMRERPTPDYFQTFGLGFFEYFQICEDLGAAPLPIINCGMACQFNSAEVVDMPQLDPYVQDALDLIEFANGGTNTKWGGLRAEMGHPAPFNMTMLGVGNEQWGPQYIERFNVFQAVIKKRYPNMKLVGAAGAGQKDQVEYLSKEFRKTNTEFIDEHFYLKPDVFESMATRYDSYPRDGSKIFVGEYASHDKESGDPLSRNTWLSALSEAAFMTGLERNADVVGMTSYAPLMANVEAWQWRPNLIWFDHFNVVATPNYYVQQFFSANSGDAVVPFTNGGKAITGADSLYGSATVQTASGKLFAKLVNASARPKEVILTLSGGKSKSAAVCHELQAVQPDNFNSMQQPSAIVPVKKTLAISANKIVLTLKPLSVNLITIE